MDHYVDIRIQPDAEFAPAMLMAALFTKLHKALAAGAHQDIGVSFPQMDVGDAAPAPTHARASRIGAHPRYALGQVLRLHGTSLVLHKLLTTDWLTGMRPCGVRHGVGCAHRCAASRGQPCASQKQPRALAPTPNA
jgi:CRISPR-associated endonuclease Csy4